MLKKNFNTDWMVKTVGTQEAVSVTLPHDAMIGEKRSKDNAGGAAMGWYPGGDYEYTKQFYADASDADKAFVLEFEGIFEEGFLWVNGCYVGSVHYGYTGARFEITPYLKWNTENTIRVKAMNSKNPNSRWYTGSGIYRPVYLYVGGKLRMDVHGLKISTPEISRQVAAVKTELKLIHEENIQKEVCVWTTIYDPEGRIAASDVMPLTISGKKIPTITQRIYVHEPKFWSVEQPNLYTCKVELKKGEEILDTAEDTFGIRSIKLDPVHGLTVNGEEVLLRGGCLHHDNGLVGAATFARAEERRIEFLKKAGFNAVRISHNSASRALLDACDRLGMLVMDEIYDIWTESKSPYDHALCFESDWQKDVADWVEKDYNHPCVFMYSIGNEITDLAHANGRIWNRILSEKVRELDSTRYVTNAINSLVLLMDNLEEILSNMAATQNTDSVTAEQPGDINDAMTALMGKMNELSALPSVEEGLCEAYSCLDLVGLNYMRDFYDVSHKDHPERIIYGSETLPPDIDLNWAKVKEYPQCVGDFTWTAWDYIGEAGIGVTDYGEKNIFLKQYPVYLAYCGDFDITGFRRPMSYYREIVFGLRKIPYIAVQLPEHYQDKAQVTPWVTPECVASWTWNGYEGKPCRVEVYSDAPEVELFVNGVSIGKQPCGESHRFKAIFETAYEPGTILAEAHYEDHTECFALESAQKETVLHLEADRTTMKKDDLVYVTVEIKDVRGIVNTSADCPVTITVEGAGGLQGYGSANPRSEENFFDADRTTFYGRAVAVIRSGQECGKITVTAQAEHYTPVTIEVEVVEE